MNILVVTPFLPYPAAPAGCPRAVFDRVRLLAPAHRLTVLTFVEPGEAQHRSDLRRLGVNLRGVPHNPDTGQRGAARWVRRVRLAVGLLGGRQPVLVQAFSAGRMRRALARLLRTQRFDVVFIEHILMAQYLDVLPPDLPVVLSEHDLRLAFPAATRTATGGPQQLLALCERAAWRRYAGRAYRRAAVVLVPTVEDADTLAAALPGVRALVVPFGLAPLPLLPENDGSRAIPPPQPHLLFIGNFDHPPNVDAAHWLCTEILPRIRQQWPEVRLWLVGRNPTPGVRALASAVVTVTGEVPSVQPYLRECAVFVAPLRTGGGMRMKLLEALAAGAPVVTTPLGARGLAAQPGQDLLVADDAPTFAAAVEQILGDPALRARLRAAGPALVGAPQRDRARFSQLDRLVRQIVRLRGADSPAPEPGAYAPTRNTHH